MLIANCLLMSNFNKIILFCADNLHNFDSVPENLLRCTVILLLYCVTFYFTYNSMYWTFNKQNRTQNAGQAQ